MEAKIDHTIFKNSYVFGLFQYLVEEYRTSNISLKFLMIYRFLKSEKLLFCSEDDYAGYMQNQAIEEF
jgi:hypothetical protein